MRGCGTLARRGLFLDQKNNLLGCWHDLILEVSVLKGRFRKRVVFKFSGIVG